MNLLMKARLILIVLVMFALCSVAAAQDYFIRTEGRVDLRDAPGDLPQSNIIEIAPMGTVLQVVSEQDGWLKINRNGTYLWMASYLYHSRMDNSQQAQTLSQSSPIDNCCSIDRQCDTDQEWTDGYHAYQVGQCDGPVRSQPATANASQIDNCCFVDRQCNTDEEWLSGFHAFQSNQCDGVQPQGSSQPLVIPEGVDNCCSLGWQCHTDEDWRSGYQSFQDNQCHNAQRQSSLSLTIPEGVNNCCFVNRQCNTDEDWQNGYAAFLHYQCRTDLPVRIEGSHYFQSVVQAAFYLLREEAPLQYAYAISGLNNVKQLPLRDQNTYGGNVVCTEDKTYYSQRGNSEKYNFERHVISEAGLLVHEACHCHRHDAGLDLDWTIPYNRIANELPCYEEQYFAHLALSSYDRYHHAYDRRKTVGDIIRKYPELSSLLKNPASYYTDF